jgi:hypothetical protein
MKQKVDPMVAGWVQAPERVLNAKGGVRQRKISGRGVRRKPNPLQPIAGSQQFVIGDIGVIVPQESAIP